MKKKASLTLIGFVLCLLAVFPSGRAYGQGEYPTRPVEVIISVSAGGSTDLTMRAMVAVATQYLGQPMIPVIRAGAGGAIGTAFVVRSKPDGHTLLISGPAPVLIRPLSEKLSYKPDDLIPISRLTASPMSIVVSGNSPWKTLKEFVEDAKKNPGKIKYASTGVFSQQHIIFELLGQVAGLKLIHIPTKGGGDAITMLLGGHVDATFMTPSPIVQHVAAKTLRVLGVDSETRSTLSVLKDVPTLKEEGFDISVPMFNGFFAPKGTPRPIIQKLETVTKQICKDESFVSMMTQMNEEIAFMGSEEYEKYLKREEVKILNLIKSMK